MRIIVLQRFDTGIREAVAKLNTKRAEEIFYTSDPHAMLAEVRRNPDALVVSGMVFDNDYYGGKNFATKAKAISPRTQFYLYSVVPEWYRHFDGIIPKDDGTIVTHAHDLLARILASVDENTTPAVIKEKFPLVIV